MDQAATLGATIGGAFDGPVDAGIEQGRMTRQEIGAEAAAHALLRLVGEHPGQMGRLRAARIIGGYAVAWRDDEDAAELARYAVDLEWPLREITRLVDAMISGRLVQQTPGPRPVLVLTRAGFRALEALDGATRVSTTAT